MKTEWTYQPAVEMHSHISLPVGRFQQILRSDGRRKKRSQEGSIFGPHSKGDHGPDIAEHRGERVVPTVGRSELSRVLGSQDQPKSILSRFGKQLSEGFVARQCAKLIDIEEVRSTASWREARPCHGGGAKARDDLGRKQVAR